MRVLCIEESGDGLLDLAIIAKRNGHEARYHLADHKAPTGKGLVDRVGDWRASANWADLIVAGGCHWLRELDALRARGKLIIGGSCDVAQWELDRLAGMAVFKRAGIQLPAFRQCMTLDDAIAYVADKGLGFACKPCGDVTDKSLTFVGKTAEDTIWRLRRWKREGKRFPSGLMVQELVKGIEFAVGGWIGPAGFAEGIEENFEEKRLFAGSLGPNCGEAGTVMRLVKRSKLFDRVLRPIEDRIVSLGYCGNIDVNTLVDEDGEVWPLEWTVRLGWPAFNIEIALHEGDPIEFLAGVAAGKPPKTRNLTDVAVGVVEAIPPYPFGHEKHDEVVGVPIWGVRIDQPGYHWCNAMIGDVPQVDNGRVGAERGLVTAGSYVGVVAGTGATVRAAAKQAYSRLKRVEIPSSPFHRVDIGERLRKQLPELQTHGYAVGLEYA